ncbi:uncharacterized protein LOC18426404 [Amborella trichopoda]|uniref:Uncharacterized protein n=1 Tax=Amborella trichopoda TaxID=13333 RepID=W1NRB7_AMBTC|nr:uncharacterized protein LOC18426404 [Amborella trichopoda]ERM98392.1 hypothetical protein AMTR_s00072p00055370 [Amborella trichopoda]|eukprot:XP_006833114.1 uncharacterized protein LOC18426404 [Amborella trichopoda]
MATTLLLWSPSGSPPPDDQTNDQDQENQPDQGRSRGRKSKINASGSSQKKVPQRGLGVAQLERLRLQEQRRKQADSEQASPFPAFPGNVSFIERHNAVNFPNRLAPMSCGGLTERHMALTDVVQRYRLRNGMRPGVTEPFGSERVPVNDMRFHNPTPFRSESIRLKELSSNQSPVCWSDQCEYCLKRKREFYGINMGAASKEGCDFLGLALWNAKNVEGEAARDIMHVHTGMAIHEGGETVTLQRSRGRELMEYDFLGGDAPLRGGDGSSSYEPPYPEPSSSFLDLSLKLST